MERSQIHRGNFVAEFKPIGGFHGSWEIGVAWQEYRYRSKWGVDIYVYRREETDRGKGKGVGRPDTAG